MSSRKYDLTELKKISSEWPEPLPDAISDQNKRENYLKNKLAVDMYINGATMSDISEKTGKKYNSILRMIERCMTLTQEGEYWGYQGLLPGVHIKPYLKREESLTQSGLFTLLLTNYPELSDFIKGNYFGDPQYTKERVMKPSTLHAKFLCKCKDLGITENEYPFNTVNKAEMSLRRYISDIKSENIELAARRENKDAYKKFMSTGIGDKYYKNPSIPFSVVQIDGHIIDLIYTVETKLEDGRIVPQEAFRCWVFAVVDVATRCVLGYSLSQQFNYNQYDVLAAIRNSILPHQNIGFSIEGFKYPDNGGFPSSAFKEAQYALFDTVMLDNAKSHLAKHTIEKITKSLNCAMCFGSVATPETRGIVERLFGTIESKGFHSIPATTGSNIRDIKRKDPEYHAKKYNITFDDIAQLIEQFFVQYNNSPHSALYGRTPLQEMEEKLKDYGMLPTIADDRTQKAVDKLLYLTKSVKVRGSIKNGKRPYIHYKYADYRNEILSSNYNMVGKDIVIYINPEDVSTLEAYTTDGISLGTLKAIGEYGLKKHSIKSRENINAYARKNKSEYGIFSTPVSDFEADLERRASKSKVARTQADILRREQGKPTLTEQKIEKENTPTTIRYFEQNITDESPKPSMPSSEAVKNMSPEEFWKSIRKVIN